MSLGACTDGKDAAPMASSRKQMPGEQRVPGERPSVAAPDDLLELLKSAQVRLFMLGGSETDEYQAIGLYLDSIGIPPAVPSPRES